MASKRTKTGLVYDKRMIEHRCLWNDDYPECPGRFTKILDRCNELELIERCFQIPSRPATLKEILMKHTQEHYDKLKETDEETNEQTLEEICTHYDVFIHPSTFQISLLAVGCAIELVDKILLGEVQNGMAIIRPPGHHAMEKSFDGFCFFNNVAIAAQHAINNHNVNRILVVDFDVHHGQGTQQLFYEDPRVLYFSIHRFDHGLFFPGLRESDFDYVGEGRGEGFNFNVALNKGGMTNADYLAIWQQILLPVAIEFQPELVLISAGYDAAYGCPLGEMEITPACYAHLILPLMTLAEGKIAALLEGGYNLESLAESAAITLRTFLGDPCPRLEMLDEPSDSVQESILNCIHSHKAFWKCLQVHEEYNPNDNVQPHFHQVIQKYIDDKDLNQWLCDYSDPRMTFPNQIRSKEVETKISAHLQYLRSVTRLDKPPNRACFVASSDKAESKDRIKEFLRKNDMLERLPCLEISSVFEEKEHKSFSKLPAEPSFGLNDLSVWKSFEPVKTLMHNVLENKYQNGICIEFEECGAASSVFHNVILAAQYAVELHGLKRVLVVDFNRIHSHGMLKNWNGKVLSISLGDSPMDSNNPEIIAESGERFAINVPLNNETFYDIDYVAAFQRIIMPVAYEFNPELVLVSADFDAINGPRTANVSPESFGYFTQWLSALANGKIVLFIKDEMKRDYGPMTTCLKALLGDPLPMLKSKANAMSSNFEAIQKVMLVQQKYWKSLKFNKMLPALHEAVTTK